MNISVILLQRNFFETALVLFLLLLFCCFCFFCQVTAYDCLCHMTVFVFEWRFKVGFHSCTSLGSVWAEIFWLGQCVVVCQFKFSWTSFRCSLFKRSSDLIKKWNKLWSYSLSPKINSIPFANIPKYLEFVSMTLPPKSRSLIAINLHVCYQYLSAVKAFFC